MLLQEVYDRYRDWSEKTSKLQEILIRTEKLRQDKYVQAMKTSTDDEAVMQTTAGIVPYLASVTDTPQEFQSLKYIVRLKRLSDSMSEHFTFAMPFL